MSALKVTVNADDLRLLILRAGPLLVTDENRRDPVVGAIDRMGDALYIAQFKAANAAKRAALPPETVAATESKVIDLMGALEASIMEARKAREARS